jgi:hypothetical protein
MGDSMIDVDTYKQLIASMYQVVINASDAEAKELFEEMMGNAVALYNQIKGDAAVLGTVADEVKNEVIMPLVVATGRQEWKGTTGSFYVSTPSVGMKLDEKRISNDIKTNSKLAEALETYWIPTSRAGTLTIRGAK